MAKTKKKKKRGKSEKGSPIVGAAVCGTLGLVVGGLAAGPVGALALGVIYAAQGAILGATGYEPDASDAG